MESSLVTAPHSSQQPSTISRHFCNTNTPRTYTKRCELQSPPPAFSCAGPRKREHRTKKLIQAAAANCLPTGNGEYFAASSHPAVPVIVPCTCVPFFSSMVTVSWLSFIRNLGIKKAFKKTPTRSLPHKTLHVRQTAPRSFHILSSQRRRSRILLGMVSDTLHGHWELGRLSDTLPDPASTSRRNGHHCTMKEPFKKSLQFQEGNANLLRRVSL